MKEKFESFCDAIDRLGEAIESEPTDLNRDGTIQRFEFTYELSWKVLKKYLASKGIVWEQADAKGVLSSEFSSAGGYRQVLSQVEPVQQQGGGCCGI